MTHPDLQYKTVKKIEKTKEAIRLNSDWITESLLRNKLYKQFKELAEEVTVSVSTVIKIKGKHENAGFREEMEYISLVRNCDFNTYERGNLESNIGKLINNLNS